MLRYLHTFTRHIWLLIIPLLLMPLAVTILLKPTYTARATLWVEQPLYVDQQRRGDGNSADSPAKQLVSLFSELMATGAFSSSVLENVPSLKASIRNEADRAAALEYISKSVRADAGSWRLVTLTITGDQSKQSLEVLDAVVKRFTAYYDERVTGQNKAAAAYYQGRLDKADITLKEAIGKLEQFTKDHPNLNVADSYNRVVRSEDIELTTLIQNRDVARRDYDDIKANLDKVQASFAAYQQGQDISLKLQDKPDIISATSEGRFRSIAIGAAVSLIVGGLLVTTIVVILTWLDRSLRMPEYAHELLGVKTFSLSSAKAPRGWQPSPEDRKAGRTRFELRRGLAEQVGINPARQLPGKK